MAGKHRAKKAPGKHRKRAGAHRSGGRHRAR